MNRVRGWSDGYTIVETMIFLAVSGTMFISAMLLINGQQQKAQFSTAIREIDSRLQDTINDVATGFYTNTNNFTCTAPSIGGNPEVLEVANADSQGKNTDCIFVGRAIQFAVAGSDGEDYITYSMVGRRLLATGNEVQSIYDAQAIPIAPGDTKNSGVPDAAEHNRLTGGLKLKYMSYRAGSGRQPIAGIGFFTTFARYSGSNLDSGSLSTDVVPFVTVAKNITSGQAVDRIWLALNPMPPAVPGTKPGNTNPIGGVTLCFQSSGTNQYGLITIGGNNQSISTKVDIYEIGSQPGAGTPLDLCA